MLDWDDLRYCLAIQRAGTLAGAASALGINATTVGRRLQSLEERLKTRIFDRTPEGFLVTPAGATLLDHAAHMEREVLAAVRALSGLDDRPIGSVRLSATEMLATRFVAPHLPQFAARYPELTLELECTNRSVSLSRREADIALRLARPRDDDVVTRRLASVPIGLYAAREYVDARGVPEDAERSLGGHTVILFADLRMFAIENDWIEARRDGAHIALRADSVSAIYAAAVCGLGITLLPRAVADKDARLVHLPTRTTPEPRTIWQAVHVDLQRTARVRAVLEFLADVLVERTPGA